MKFSPLAIVATVAVVAAVASSRGKKKARKKTTKAEPGIDPTKDVVVNYAAGGENVYKLRAGDRIFVKYDVLSPFRYEPAPTEVTAAIEPKEGQVGFLVTKTLPTGAVDQVYVAALGEDDTVLGEHKITIIGP